jgi:membrane-associated phospholipid phosphatase
VHWLQSIDSALFHCINRSLENPFFDWLMPVLSGNWLFVPGLIVFAAWLVVRGGTRGRVCLVCLLLGLAVGDGLVGRTMKKAVARPRPFVTLPEARTLVGRTESGSLPSSHALNAFAAATIAGFFFRRSRRVLVPLACGIALSRVYNGVHYPSDILAGAVLGVGVGYGVLHGLDALWAWAGRRWFPCWHALLPSLLKAPPPGATPPIATPEDLDRHWLRLGYALIGFLLVSRFLYLLGGSFELSEDEAYQWLWSKHLALSYYSKPPMIALTQWAGTHLWGDTEFGVRFFSPVIAAVLGWITLRFCARHATARLGFCLLVVLATTPILAVGSTLMTIDPLSVLFWTASMLSGWRAVQGGRTGDWLWTGFWMGLGFLSKYTALIQLACWACFFCIHAPARVALRRPGPWLALGVLAVCTLPVLAWNWEHGWITVTHLAERGGLDTQWRFRPGLIFDFTLNEFGLMNPVWFVASLMACVAAWKSRRAQPLQFFLLCMGAPLFLFYWLYTVRTRVLPNWIAPAILPIFLLMGLYWWGRWATGSPRVLRWFKIGAGLGLVAVVLAHETRLITRITGLQIPPKQDPLRRVRGWTEAAEVVRGARSKLLEEGKPVFIIGSHYGITGQLSFYLPEARSAVQAGGPALVYYQSSDHPQNQFYFWPGYRDRKGQNALYVVERSVAEPPPQRLVAEFDTVADLGLHEVHWKGRVLRRLQIYACRGLL